MAARCSIKGAREGSEHPSRADPRELNLPWAVRNLLRAALAMPGCDGYADASAYAKAVLAPICRDVGISVIARMPNAGERSNRDVAPFATRHATVPIPAVWRSLAYAIVNASGWPEPVAPANSSGAASTRMRDACEPTW